MINDSNLPPSPGNEARPGGERDKRCGIFLPLTSARVAQWIRALASGARGRRFDPCRGY